MSVRSHGPDLPVILLANELGTGAVVLATATGWSHDVTAALVADTAPAAASLVQRGQDATAANQVVDAGLVPVRLGADGTVQPLRLRDQIRLVGPSIPFGVAMAQHDGGSHVSV
ncbi:MAG: DUF2849 domain-containing protein [Alphaproteobacteria bacterium]|nr:DUF2849 domain-containing protein [Alphaproteobacteria bacterium]